MECFKKIDNDKIIIGGDVDGLIKIISISQKKINIKNKFQGNFSFRK